MTHEFEIPIDYTTSYQTLTEQPQNFIPHLEINKDFSNEAVGWFGVAGILGAYFLLTKGKILAKSKIYQAMNLVGAGSLIYYNLSRDVLPGVGINVVWLGIAGWGLYKAIKNREK